jgi:lysophospholipase L1-like esterase
MHPLASRPALTLYLLGTLAAVPHGLPADLALPGGLTVARLRLFAPLPEPSAPVAAAPVEASTVGAVEVGGTEDDGHAEVAPAAPARPGLPFQKTPEATASPELKAKGRSIEDPSGKALDAFFASLARTEAKQDGAITRITYYGDSVIASDWITATLRRKLQGQFGDAGHGFILVADAWPGYHHDNIARFASKGWKVSRVVGPYAPDGIYGLGGVSFVADGPGMFATVGSAKSGEVGRSVSRFRVTYAEHPGGGKLSLKLDGGEARVLSTSADTPAVKTADIEAPDGAHNLEIRSLGGGPVRVFHTILERDVPGVVVDAVGIIGCRLRFLDKMDDAHWADELKRRNPNLIAFTYGANESGDSFAYPMDQYEATARAVLKQARDALPGASCLLIGPMDAADKRGDALVSRPVVPAINNIQRKLAAELGCGFFDTWQAMGGHGSMGVWIQRGLGGADLVHPTSSGAELIGGWVHGALMEGFAAFKARNAAPAPSGN